MSHPSTILRIRDMAGPTEVKAFRARLTTAGLGLLAAAGHAATEGVTVDHPPMTDYPASGLLVLLSYAVGWCPRLSAKNLEQAAGKVAMALDQLESPEGWAQRPTYLRALLHCRSFALTDPVGVILEAALCRHALAKGYDVMDTRLSALAGVHPRRIQLAINRDELRAKGTYVLNERAKTWLDGRGVRISARPGAE